MNPGELKKEIGQLEQEKDQLLTKIDMFNLRLTFDIIVLGIHQRASQLKRKQPCILQWGRRQKRQLLDIFLVEQESV